MKEFLYITLILFGGFLPFFFIFQKFIYMKFVILGVLFFIFIGPIFESCNFNGYNLCERKKIENIQELEDYPVKSLKAIFYENGTFKNIEFGVMSDKSFSLIETEYYSTQCLKNYYIEYNMTCPITDRKLKNKNSSEYQNRIQINDEEYLFYTRENKLDKLYKSFNYYDFKNNKEEILSLDKIIRSEFHKLSNPLIDFKKFTIFFIEFCFTFLPTIFIFAFCLEHRDDLKCDIMKIINTFIFQLILTILSFIRFIKFIDCKNFLFENKDIYYDENNFLNEIFNLDIFPLGICINLLLYNILYIIFQNRLSFIKCMNDDIFIENSYFKLIFFIYILIISLSLPFIFLFLFQNTTKLI